MCALTVEEVDQKLLLDPLVHPAGDGQRRGGVHLSDADA